MPHKHWPKDHPFYERAPVHDTTVKECDRLWTEYLHDHVGTACVKQVKPGNVKATCVLVGQEKADAKEAEKERREAAFQDFAQKEKRRIATLLREYD